MLSYDFQHVFSPHTLNNQNSQNSQPTREKIRDFCCCC